MEAIYGIINIADLTKIDFSKTISTSKDTIRKSLDGKLFMIKWEKNKEPKFIKDKVVIPVSKLNYSDAKTLADTKEWKETIE